MKRVLVWCGAVLLVVCVAVGALVAVFGWDGFVGKVFTMGVKDAGGMTRVQVESLSPEERFDLYGERYERIQELMTGAQLQISEGVWKWNEKGVAGPWPGFTALASFPGASVDNTYYMELWRTTTPAGATGERSEAEAMLAYFESQGWEASLSDYRAGNELAGELDESEWFQRWDVRAVTEDGFFFILAIDSDGRHRLSVTSSPYWFGGQNIELSHEIRDRIPYDTYFGSEGFAGAVIELNDAGEFAGVSSAPGVYTPFPKWSDPRIPDPNKIG